MNIVFIIHSLAVSGGVERTLTDKANFLAMSGHKVTMVTYEQGQHPLVFDLHSEIEHFDLDCRYFTLYKSSFIKRLVKGWKLKKLFYTRWNRIISKIKPDIIVITTYSDEFRKEIMSVKSSGVPIVMESHTAFFLDKRPQGFIDKYRLQRDLSLIRKCDMVLALSKGDASFWKKYVNNVCVLPNPVSFYYEDLSQFSGMKLPNRIISVGRLRVLKRFDLLIDAFSVLASKYPEWYLDIFGSGPLKGQLEERVDRLGLNGRVIFNNPSSKISEEYMRSQFLVLSSDYEGFSLVLLEAMACGIPVVSTDCPYGPVEIIEDGVTGLLSKINVEDLADKMEWMMTHHKELITMGEKAHMAASKYKKDIVMEQWEKAYLSVLDA